MPHIGRLNLRSELGRQILDAADVHLGAMSIPYALAIHDDFLRECIHLLVTARKCTAGQAAKAKSMAAKHPLIAQSTGGTAVSRSSHGCLSPFASSTAAAGGRCRELDTTDVFAGRNVAGVEFMGAALRSWALRSGGGFGDGAGG